MDPVLAEYQTSLNEEGYWDATERCPELTLGMEGAPYYMHPHNAQAEPNRLLSSTQEASGESGKNARRGLKIKVTKVIDIRKKNQNSTANRYRHACCL